MSVPICHIIIDINNKHSLFPSSAGEMTRKLVPGRYGKLLQQPSITYICMCICTYVAHLIGTSNSGSTLSESCVLCASRHKLTSGLHYYTELTWGNTWYRMHSNLWYKTRKRKISSHKVNIYNIMSRHLLKSKTSNVWLHETLHSYFLLLHTVN